MTQTLRWHQVAIIDAENITEAVEEATLAIDEWSSQGFTGPGLRHRSEVVVDSYERCGL